MSGTRTSKRVDLKTAQAIGRMLVDVLGPACERIEVAGSVRRGKATIGDIEIVAIPKVIEHAQTDLFGNRVTTESLNLAENLLLTHVAADREEANRLMDKGKLPVFRSRHAAMKAVGVPVTGPERPVWGEKYKKVFLPVSEEFPAVQVDVYFCDAVNWGAILAIRTGPGDFAQALVTRIKYQTRYRQDGGYLRDADGEIVFVREERDYFMLAGVPWMEPGERTVRALKAITSPPGPLSTRGEGESEPGGEQVTDGPHPPAPSPKMREGEKSDLPGRVASRRVQNIKHLPPGWKDDPRYVYIGRRNDRAGVPQSKWANPFHIGVDGDRETVIRLYRAWLADSPELMASLDELRGKVLVCWCAPKGCHGDVLVEAVQALTSRTSGPTRGSAPTGRAGEGEDTAIPYTTDAEVRAAIRVRLEAGIVCWA